MKVKIDTKEIINVITLEELYLTVNMTEELQALLLSYLKNKVTNVVLSFKNVTGIDVAVADKLVDIQQAFYEAKSSMVFCGLQPGVEKFLEENGQLEVMNVTPTESEACDIVQMEEIERELY